jgi:hypothetical protein
VLVIGPGCCSAYVTIYCLGNGQSVKQQVDSLVKREVVGESVNALDIDDSVAYAIEGEIGKVSGEVDRSLSTP